MKTIVLSDKEINNILRVSDESDELESRKRNVLDVLSSAKNRNNPYSVIVNIFQEDYTMIDGTELMFEFMEARQFGWRTKTDIHAQLIEFLAGILSFDLEAKYFGRTVVNKGHEGKLKDFLEQESRDDCFGSVLDIIKKKNEERKKLEKKASVLELKKVILSLLPPGVSFEQIGTVLDAIYNAWDPDAVEVTEQERYKQEQEKLVSVLWASTKKSCEKISEEENIRTPRP